MRAKLKALREANGYTQQTLSDAIGMSRSHYSQVESGDKQPSLKLALRIKRALNYYGDDIFDNTIPPELETGNTASGSGSVHVVLLVRAE